MESNIDHIAFKLIVKPDKEQLSAIINILTNTDGIGPLSVSDKSVVVEYNIYKLTKEAIINKIKQADLVLAVKKQKQSNFIKRFIDKLAKENKEYYRDGKLDCCEMNH